MRKNKPKKFRKHICNCGLFVEFFKNIVIKLTNQRDMEDIIC